MRLYELTMQYQRLLDEVEEAEGELTDEQWEMLEILDGAFDDKVENLAKFVRSIQADADAVKTERQRLAAREKSLGNKVDWLKRYLQQALEAAGKDKVKGRVLNVSLRRAPVSCIVRDLDLVPPAFKEEVTTINPDKTAITRHFKQTGEVLPGVEMVTDKRYLAIS